MSVISFKLDMFEGPLDLLLHLIQKHKLDIMDIEISLLLEQYLEYIEQLDYEDYEYAGEFLEMAARLIYIKTVSLLPKPEEAQELKQELQGRILEYSVCKQLASKLRGMYLENGVFVREELTMEQGSKAYELTHAPEELVSALLAAGKKKAIPEPQIKARDFGNIVSHKIYSVTSKILYVLKKLYKTGSFEMNGLYVGMKEKSERIATFLAILELTKSGRITLSDDNSVIYFKRRTKEERAIEHSRTKTEEQRLLEEEGEYIPEAEEKQAPELPQDKPYAVFEPFITKEQRREMPVRVSSEKVMPRMALDIIILEDEQPEQEQPQEEVSAEPPVEAAVTEPQETKRPAPAPVHNTASHKTAKPGHSAKKPKLNITYNKLPPRDKRRRRDAILTGVCVAAIGIGLFAAAKELMKK